MKSLVLIFLVFLSVNVFGVSYESKTNEIPITESLKSNYYGGIDDGWYRATVRVGYSTYTLRVYVEYNKVTVIDFGNGGNVHDGYNNSGYTYHGGSLSFDTDYQGNIVSASTTVTIMDGLDSRYFHITIE
jgi:hypothetical protein